MVCVSVLLPFLLWGCQPQEHEQAQEKHSAEGKSISAIKAELNISIIPLFKQKVVRCNTELVMNDDKWKTNEFATFISDIRIQQQGNSYPIKLVDNPWQSQNVGLIRQSSNCKAETTNLVLSGNFNGDVANFIEDEPAELHFTMGLPFALNHQNPVTQPSPLNDSSMFWVWRNGYKFLRWDMQSSKGDSWSFHLGSVGCQSSSVVRAPKIECAYPNTVAFVLPLSTFQRTGDIELGLDLEKILGSISPTKRNTCMFSSIDDKTCVVLMNNLKTAMGKL